MRAGVLGGISAFIGFTLPSVIALVLFAMVLQGFDIGTAGWIHGLKIVAVAVVAHAVLGMAQKLTPDKRRKAIALFALVATLLWQTAFTQVGVILLAAFAGYLIYKEQVETEDSVMRFPVSRRFAAVCLSLFFGLLDTAADASEN